MISAIHGIQDKKQQINKQTNKNKITDTDNRMAVTRGEKGVGRMRKVQGVKCKVMGED